MNSGGRFQVFYDKKNDRWLIYTNHFGEKQIFYLKLPDRVVFASELPWIMKYIKNNGVSYSIDEIGAYFLLTYSYMLEDYTIIKEIKKLPAGCYIKIEDGNFKILRYFKIDNTLTEDEMIENIDRLFKNAVKLEFEKNKQYKYKHIASLSGGLDSRMTVWVAHELGYTKYTNQLNVTFSDRKSVV